MSGDRAINLPTSNPARRRRPAPALRGARLAWLRRRFRGHHPARVSDGVGYSPLQVGIVATAALLGSAVLTLASGSRAAPRPAQLLLAGAGLIALPGWHSRSASTSPSCWVAFFGTINPSTGDGGGLVPLEHAMLARGVADSGRTAAFARYSLIGASRARRIAGGGDADISPRRHRAGDRVQADVPRLRGARPCQRRALPAPAACRDARDALDPARAVARHGLQARRAVQPRFVRRRAAVQSMLALWLFERFELRSRPRACSSSGRARSPLLVSGRGLARNASAWSTPWCSPTSRRASSSSWRRSRPT